MKSEKKKNFNMANMIKSFIKIISHTFFAHPGMLLKPSEYKWNILLKPGGILLIE
jgi:hypothetical protein